LAAGRAAFGLRLKRGTPPTTSYEPRDCTVARSSNTLSVTGSATRMTAAAPRRASARDAGAMAARA
jgi:hypothetical protein